MATIDVKCRFCNQAEQVRKYGTNPRGVTTINSIIEHLPHMGSNVIDIRECKDAEEEVYLLANEIKKADSCIYHNDRKLREVNRALINKTVVTPIDLLMVKFTFYKRSNNLIVHLFAFR
ncbi:hypothetical protein ACUHZR_20525, partial [Photobacterium damselae subsp. piscicida]